MRVPISEKLLSLKAYDPVVNTGGIHLDSNESFLGLPSELKAEIARKIAAISENRYPDPLASGVCAAFGRRYGISSEYVTAGNGSDELISLLLASFVEKGGKVLITQPDFSMYSIYCAMAELEAFVLNKNDDLTFDPGRMIEEANRSQVRMILFSNPCNPTGGGLDSQAVLTIVENVSCIVVVDEAYMDFWDQSIVRRAAEYENLIVLKTCSKIGLAAARLGFAVANRVLTGLIRAAKSPYNVNALTQAAGEAFLNADAFLEDAISQVRSSRDSLYAELRKVEADFPDRIRVFPTYTNFVTAEVQGAQELYGLLRDSGISIRLLGGKYFRVTAGTPEENRIFIQTLKNILGGR